MQASGLRYRPCLLQPRATRKFPDCGPTGTRCQQRRRKRDNEPNRKKFRRMDTNRMVRMLFLVASFFLSAYFVYI